MTATTDWSCPRGHDRAVTTVWGWPICGECGMAPAYHERWDRRSPNVLVEVVVPLDAQLGITPGSAIVTSHLTRAAQGGRQLHYFEGRVHSGGIATPEQFLDAATHAAERMVTQYPTVAFGLHLTDSFLTVGTLNCSPGGQSSLDIVDEIHLEEWRGF